MPRYAFATAELLVEHRRHAVRDVTIDANLSEHVAAEADRFTGPPEIEGELAMECAAGENPLRPGMMPLLKLTISDGRFTRVVVLLTELKQIETPQRMQRLYRWGFLIPRRPGSDGAGLFRRPGEPEPPRPAPIPTWSTPRPPKSTLQADPEAFEISLEVLLATLGPTTALPPAKFTSEGGFETA